jgi:flagellum-specific peptidoglycan hydrolase FlgJ
LADRKEYHAKYYRENREAIVARRQARQADINAAESAKYHNDPEYNASRKRDWAKQRAKQAERYATDPEYRKKVDERKAANKQKYDAAYHRERKAAWRKKQQEERYATDPEYRRKVDAGLIVFGDDWEKRRGKPKGSVE